MNYLHVREKSEKPMSPPQIIQAKVDVESIGESSRQEWFIKGTEVSNVVAGSSEAKSHILSPVTGTVIVLDVIEYYESGSLRHRIEAGRLMPALVCRAVLQDVRRR
ncbi:MAG: hypothetical protein ABL869_03910 [Candidatus Nitrotoga sp.]